MQLARAMHVPLPLRPSRDRQPLECQRPLGLTGVQAEVQPQ